MSETISHKTDVGGVKLNLADENSVRQAFRQIKVSVTATAGPESVLGVTVQPMILRDGWELILGSSTDPQFGPVILFGSGGQLVEVYRDHALALPPLNTTLAHRLMEQTRIYTALKGVRGRKPVDMDALEALLVRFSRLVVEQPWIAEIDMNPLLVSSERFLALDARVLLHNPALRADQLPQPAIRPYPAQYISQLIMKDGTRITVRPIRPEDEPLMVGFHKLLSDQSVYQRFFRQLRLDTRVAHDRLVRICFGDYSRDIALVAELAEEGAAESKDVQAAVEPRIVAVGRLNRLHARNEAEVAVLIADGYQHRGLGTEILRRVVQVAREERMGRLSAEVLTTNIAMQRMFRRMGFHLESPDGSDSIHAELQL
jgi:acetyltransferase